MALQVNDVSKKFGDTTAVHALNLHIPKGEMFGLLGGNGAGKTTTFRMTLGLLSPTEGLIRWNGKSINYETSNSIGYLPEERGLYPKLKVKEQLIYLGKLKGMTKKECIEQMRFWLDRFNVPEYEDKKVDDLSKGNQQKIQFIAAVLHKPELLILDEPFSGLDPVNVEVLKEAVLYLKDNGTTIVFSSHRMDHVEELCENLCILHKGKAIVYGSLKEVKESYGRKNVLIHADFPLEEIKQIDGVEGYKKVANGAEIKINDEKVSQEIFQFLQGKGFISKFALTEPTLNEIFIEKVGGLHE